MQPSCQENKLEVTGLKYLLPLPPAHMQPLLWSSGEKEQLTSHKAAAATATLNKRLDFAVLPPAHINTLSLCLHHSLPIIPNQLTYGGVKFPSLPHLLPPLTLLSNQH